MKKIEKNNLYQIAVYEGTKEQYITFCTPECTWYIDLYLTERRKMGEVIRDDASLIRQLFDIKRQSES